MTPELQRIAALERANLVRLGFAAVKREVREGSLPFADALDDDRAQGMLVMALVSSQFRWGTDRTRKAMRHAGVSDRARVCNLTARQREALVLASRLGLRSLA